MDKPIPEAVLDRLAQEAYQVHCDTPIRPFPNDTHWPKWRAVVQHVVNALTAAQQQGQESGEVDAEDLRWCEDIAESLREAGGPTNNMRLVALNRLLRHARTAPPSAPVGRQCTLCGGTCDADDRCGRCFAPPSAPVGVERREQAIRQVNYILWMDGNGGCEPSAEWQAGYQAALAQQPAAVDGAGKVSVRESALRYCIRELNGARRGDNAEGRAELVHHVLTAWLDLAAQHQEPTT